MKKVMVTLMILTAGTIASAAYSVDADTLHLYHFDGDATDAAGSLDLTLGNGAAYTGGALDVYDRFEAEQTSPYAGNEGRTVSEFTGADGAFTFEAMIQPYIGLGQQNHHMQIISGDGDGSSRGWHFRINGSSQLQFTKIAGGVEDFTFGVPQGGANVHYAGHWYHVAVTYNGMEGQADNLKFYWTKADAGFTEAQLLASFTMSADMDGASTADFCVGNELRGAADENYEGLIDEVRISSIARSAGDMTVVPEPATMVLLGLGGLILRRKK